MLALFPLQKHEIRAVLAQLLKSAMHFLHLQLTQPVDALVESADKLRVRVANFGKGCRRKAQDRRQKDFQVGNNDSIAAVDLLSLFIALRLFALDRL